MKPPRGGAYTLISIATGMVAALAVSLTWFPLIQERESRALEDQGHQLELVALLAVDRLLDELVYLDEPLPELGGPSPVLPMEKVRLHEARTAIESTLPGVVALAELERIVVVDTRQRLVGARPARASAVYGDHINDPALTQCDLVRVMEDRRAQRVFFREDDRERRQAICVPVWRSGESVQGALVVVADSEPVVARSRERGRDLLVVMTVAGIAALVTVVGIRQLLNPLSLLSRAAGRIASGERGVRVEVRGPQEVQQLARAMNALASAVESHEDEVGGRIEMVQQLTSMVAHEVRNPLQSLSLLVTLARTEPDPETRDGQLLLIDDEIKGLEGVVQRFLSMKGPLRIVGKETDLVPVVERALAITAPRASSMRVALRKRLPRHLPMVADPSLLRRALENLILNAVEFAADGAESPRVEISVEQDADLVLIRVDDNGPGVPEDQRERIFHPYVTGRAGGTGLGLALVRQVVEAHGGYIRCERSPLGGARFVAGLPRTPPAEEA